MRRAGARSRGRVLVFVLLGLAAGATADASPTVDDVVLHVDRGVNPGEVKLQWTGGAAPFTIYRSTSPVDVTNQANVIGTTSGFSYVDVPPAVTVFYELIGKTCIGNGECQMGHCVDGFCCNSPCTGICLACNVAGHDGTCTPIPSGSDPAAECGPASACNGAGTCRSLNGQA